MNWNIYFDIPDTSKMEEKDFQRICSIERDMWARNEWRGEYMICKCCWKIMSKQDVFSHISKDIYIKTVSEIEKILWYPQFSCDTCNSNNVVYFYPENIYLNNVIERYKKKTFLVIARESITKNIIGFVDWYVETLDDMFEIELKDHYWSIWITEVKKKVYEKIWFLPDVVFSCSSLWTVEEYMNMTIIFNLLTVFFNSVPEEYADLVWISELNFWGSLHSIYHALWAKALWFKWDERLTNLGESYNSDVFLQEKLIKTYRGEFSSWIREFMRKNAKKMREVKSVN